MTIKEDKLWVASCPPVGTCLTRKVRDLKSTLTLTSFLTTAADGTRYQTLAGGSCLTARHERAWSISLESVICMTKGKLHSLSGHHFLTPLKGHSCLPGLLGFELMYAKVLGCNRCSINVSYDFMHEPWTNVCMNV